MGFLSQAQIATENLLFFYLSGSSINDVCTEGGGYMWEGEGVQNPTNYLDIIYGWPLPSQFSPLTGTAVSSFHHFTLTPFTAKTRARVPPGRVTDANCV